LIVGQKRRQTGIDEVAGRSKRSGLQFWISPLGLR
jgi:hypothetical protein